jgi:predicted RNA methylase
MATTVVLYYTKGLAAVALAELADLAKTATVEEHTDRFAIATVDDEDLTSLRQRTRVIDDIRILVGRSARVANLQDLISLCEEAHAKTSAIVDSDGRAKTGDWSITVSARNPAWRQGEGWSPAETIAKQLHGADIDGTHRQPVDLRLQVDEERAHLAVNFASPVKRGSEGPNRAGALRPTVAAAMLRLVTDGLPPAATRLGIYDPFCGSGTIVAEAVHAGFRVFGSDIDEQAVQMTRQRLTASARDRSVTNVDMDADSLSHRIFNHDVLKGYPPRVNARVLVGNMPWGKQIKIDRHRELFDATCVLVAKTVEQGGAAVLLTTNEDRFVARLRSRMKAVDVAVCRIGLLGQTPALVTVRHGGSC